MIRAKLAKSRCWQFRELTHVGVWAADDLPDGGQTSLVRSLNKFTRQELPSIPFRGKKRILLGVPSNFSVHESVLIALQSDKSLSFRGRKICFPKDM